MVFKEPQLRLRFFYIQNMVWYWFYSLIMYTF